MDTNVNNHSDRIQSIITLVFEPVPALFILIAIAITVDITYYFFHNNDNNKTQN